MGYPRSGYRSPGARAMAEAGYQKRKAAGQTRPLSELAERAQRSRSDGIRSMDHGTSKGQLVPQAKPPVQQTLENVPYRVLREMPVADRNRLFARLARMSPNGRIRHMLSLLGVSYQDALAEGLINLLNALPGFNPGVDPHNAQFTFTSNLNGLPLYKVCRDGGPTSLKLEALQSQANSCLTGQAVTVGDFFVNVGANKYVSTYSSYQVWPSGSWRGHELASYGPAPAGGFRASMSWSTGNLTVLRTATTPWTMVPTRPQTLTYTAGYGPPTTATPTRTLWMTPRRRPGRGVKERKSKVSRALIAITDTITDGIEVIEFAWDALPDSCKSKLKGNKANRIAQKGRDVYRCWSHIDLNKFLFEWAWSQISDRVWAEAGVKNPYGRYGQSMAANKAIGNMTADTIADLLTGAKQLTADTVTRLTGVKVQ